ncbi:hypothetical protein SCLCIDRAFT_25051 [Scleroderma citrinum Foug A]|uniref:Uncharacterized protein n=1 Tax=Scleroderma citrinum Foug A TaxID=1036808 RepID=A0A0C3E2L3_9AGAM|nr:hypothetical protein SCLCIDRAFT_25051 [Scleroderma citrinum Foug A]
MDKDIPFFGLAVAVKLSQPPPPPGRCSAVSFSHPPRPCRALHGASHASKLLRDYSFSLWAPTTAQSLHRELLRVRRSRPPPQLTDAPGLAVEAGGAPRSRPIHATLHPTCTHSRPCQTLVRPTAQSKDCKQSDKWNDW